MTIIENSKRKAEALFLLYGFLQTSNKTWLYFLRTRGTGSDLFTITFLYTEGRFIEQGPGDPVGSRNLL